MHHLRVLGTPTLESDDALVAGRAVQRHRLALLAVLASAPGHRLSRDKLLAFLWPERDAESGRNLLRVAIYVLRQELGQNALLSEGDDLHLNTEVIDADVAEFDAAIARHDLKRAIELYRGPFLDGFFLSDAPEFESWSDRQRTRLAGDYRNALESLASSAQTAGDTEAAVRWWQMLAAHDPYDSGIALRLMQAMAALGNRAGALQHAAVHERLLQEEFGVALPAEIVLLTDELKQQPASATSPPQTPVSVDRPSFPAESVPTNPRRRLRTASRTMPILAVLLVALAAALLGLRGGSANDRRSPAIAVLPFDNVGNPEDEYFAAGMTDEITSRLGTVSGLGVVSSRTAGRYTHPDITVREIGRALSVDYVLHGSVRWTAEDGPSDRKVRVTTELLRTSDERQLWATTYDRVIDDIFDVQSDIAAQVVARLGVTVKADERRRLVATPAENHEAYTLYLKGRYYWNKRSKKRAQAAYEYFQQAVDLDPGYALAWAGIADVWILRGWYSLLPPRETFPRAKQAALRALELDSTLAEAHASMAHIHLEFDHDWPAAEREYLRAIALQPSYAIAHHWYGGFLSAMGRHEEAMQHAQMARGLDPLAPIIQTWIGLRYYFAGKYEAAIVEYLKAIELDREFAPAHWHLGWAYEQTGRFDEGIASARRALASDSQSTLYQSSLAHAYAVAGRTAEARAILARLLAVAGQRHVSAYHLAVVYLGLGETDAALDWLDRAFDEKAPWIGYMAVDPRLAALRGHPRFNRLLKRARLQA